MRFDGVTYSKSHLHRLACATDGMAGDLAGAGTRFEASSGAARAALGDDDYGRAYWQARGQRMKDIGTGLDLLATALRRQETRIQRASQNYDGCEDASTLR
ncbi:hypothetical protein [Nonomuraea sp. SBT364]|uniref:hypothetical protein n=1 Tax=Nonomuraea sp. SBT364 TaxID=1580530 RepID=UPI00066ADDE3|nr:hypothetical protein [Nonomuraea sp. SBT364]